MRKLLATAIIIYLFGAVFYSSLFLFSANQSYLVQIAKIFIAAVHILILILPVYMIQSGFSLVRLLGHIVLFVAVLYALFLVGFVPYFGFVPELYSYGAKNAADLLEVSNHYFAQFFGWREVSLIASYAGLIIIARKGKLPLAGLSVLLLPAALFGASVFQFGVPVDSRSFGNLTVIRRFGPVAFSYVSLIGRLNADEGYLAEQTPFPGKLSELISDAPATGKLHISRVPIISHLVMVQIESFDPEVLDAELSGLAVMPFVSALKKNCLSYTNFLTTKAAGGSSDSEFSVTTGLVPSTRLPALMYVDFEGIVTLYDRLAEVGVTSNFAHNNQSGFYGRHRAYLQLDTVTSKFESPADMMPEADFALASLSDSMSRGENVLHYYFNFASHGPYQGYTKQTGAKFGIKAIGDLWTDYRATMHEVDSMVSGMFNSVSDEFESGKLMFVLTADHPSGINQSAGGIDTARIPSLICHRDFQEQIIDTVYSAPDFHPTILEAFGIELENVPTVGQSMFRDEVNAVLLPSRNLVFNTANGGIELRQCGGSCDRHIAYTEQHLSTNLTVD